jgi:hypothetical protein
MHNLACHASKELSEREVLVRCKRCLKQALLLVLEAEDFLKRSGGDDEAFGYLTFGKEILTAQICHLDGRLEALDEDFSPGAER